MIIVSADQSAESKKVKKQRVMVTHPIWKKKLAVKLYNKGITKMQISRVLEVAESTSRGWINNQICCNESIEISAIPKTVLNNINQLGIKIAGCFSLKTFMLPPSQPADAEKIVKPKAQRGRKRKIVAESDAKLTKKVAEVKLPITPPPSDTESLDSKSDTRRSLRFVVKRRKKLAQNTATTVKENRTLFYEDYDKLPEIEKKITLLSYLGLGPKF